jgi:hypothetical protein
VDMMFDERIKVSKGFASKEKDLKTASNRFFIESIHYQMMLDFQSNRLLILIPFENAQIFQICGSRNSSSN